jgi:hypothetical protein
MFNVVNIPQNAHVANLYERIIESDESDESTAPDAIATPSTTYISKKHAEIIKKMAEIETVASQYPLYKRLLMRLRTSTYFISPFVRMCILLSNFVHSDNIHKLITVVADAIMLYHFVRPEEVRILVVLLKRICTRNGFDIVSISGSYTTTIGLQLQVINIVKAFVSIVVGQTDYKSIPPIAAQMLRETSEAKLHKYGIVVYRRYLRHKKTNSGTSLVEYMFAYFKISSLVPGTELKKVSDARVCKGVLTYTSEGKKTEINMKEKDVVAINNNEHRSSTDDTSDMENVEYVIIFPSSDVLVDAYE